MRNEGFYGGLDDTRTLAFRPNTTKSNPHLSNAKLPIFDDDFGQHFLNQSDFWNLALKGDPFYFKIIK